VKQLATNIALVTSIAGALHAAARAQGAIADEVLAPTLTSSEQFFDVEPSFGYAIAVEAGRMFVGGPNWNEGLAGDQSGIVFHHLRAADGSWPYVLRATGSGTQGFGHAVDLEGATVAVSGYRSLELGWIQIAVEVPGTGWPTVATFDRASVGASRRFGASLDLEGDWIAVGAPGVIGSGVSDRGNVTLLRRDGAGTWSFFATILPPFDTDVGFGADVALDGDTLLVCDEYSVGGTTPSTASGAVHVHRRAANDVWSYEATLDDDTIVPLSLNHARVAIDQDRVVVGAPRQLTGPFLSGLSGMVYEWRRDTNGTWTLVSQIAPPTPTLSYRFGADVALRGNRLAVLSEGETILGPISNGRRSIDLFERDDSGTWHHVVRCTTPLVAQPTASSVGDVELSDDQVFFANPGDDGGRVHVVDLGTLYRGSGTLDLSSGGTHPLYLRAGADHAGDLFVVLGTASGTAPGIDIGVGTLPLVFDAYTQFLVDNGGAALVAPWVGLLDVHGRSDALVALPSDTNAAFAGITLHHAFVAFDAVTLAPTLVSNAVAVELVP
jgi:hypothetical protein